MCEKIVEIEMLSDRYGEVKVQLKSGDVVVGKSIAMRPWFDEQGKYSYDVIQFICSHNSKELLLGEEDIETIFYDFNK